MDEVVAEQHGERLLADVVRRAEHRVAQPSRRALPGVVDRGQFGRLPDAREPLVVALGLEHLLQFRVPVEVVFQRALGPAGDQQDVAQPGGDRLFDHVLDGGLVDDGQHLFGDRLGRGQESCSEPGGGDHCLAHGWESGHVDTLDECFLPMLLPGRRVTRGIRPATDISF